MSVEEQVAAPSVGENPEVLADQPTSMVTDEDPANNGASVRRDSVKVKKSSRILTLIEAMRGAHRRRASVVAQQL